MVGDPNGVEVFGKDPGIGIKVENSIPTGKAKEIKDPMANATRLNGNPGEKEDQQISNILRHMGLPTPGYPSVNETQRPIGGIPALKTEVQKKPGFIGWIFSTFGKLFHSLTFNLFRSKAAQSAG